MVPRQKQAPDSKPVSYTHSNMKQYVAVTLIFGFIRANLVQKSKSIKICLPRVSCAIGILLFDF